MAITDSETRLELHVFGASQGESIALALPNDRWGVVDCHATSLTNPADNHVAAFLSERGVTELEFLCLTHPHEDHFRGMSRLLQDFTVRFFWRPAAMSGQRLKWLLKMTAVEAKRSNAQTALDNASELERIFTLVRQARKATSQPLIPKDAVLGAQLYPIPVNPYADLQIWAVAPSGRQMERFEEALGNCFDEHGSLKDRLPYARHNDVSLALLIQFGETRILLGGDVEKSGWADSMEEFGSDRLNSHAVKVSHHGSANGYCDGLWEAFARDGKPIAVVTAFRRHRLPTREGLERIRPLAERILTPCLPAIRSEEPPIPFSPTVPPRSREALRDEFKVLSASAAFPTGCCSLVFDRHGQSLEQIAEPPAGEIP